MKTLFTRAYRISFFVSLVFSAAPDSAGQQQPVEIRRHKAPVRTVSWSADGKTLVTAGDDKMVCCWQEPFQLPAASFENPLKVRAARFAGQEGLLLASGTDVVWKDFSGKLHKTFPGGTTEIWSFDFHPETNQMAAGSYSKNIRMWEFSSAAPLNDLSGHLKSCLAVSIHPHGNYLLSGSLDKTVRLWDLQTGNLLHSASLHAGNVFATAWHPSGRYAATASADKTIRIWQTDSLRCIRVLRGHTGQVFDVAFSADGYLVASASEDNTVILWDLITGRSLHVFTGHTGPVHSVRMDPAGRLLASASDDATVRLEPLLPKYFAVGFYDQEVDSEIAPLLRPRAEGETRQDFQSREAKALLEMEKIYDAWYMKYMQWRTSKPFEQLMEEHTTLQ